MQSAGHDTVLAAAMARAGGPNRAEAQFTVAIARAVAQFERDGGTMTRARALLVEAAGRLPSEGLLTGAVQGQQVVADARQPNGDEAGQTAIADEASANMPSSSPTECSGEGHTRHADEAFLELPSTAAPHREIGGQGTHADKATGAMPPAREPSAIDLAAMRAVRQSASLTVLDTIRVPDGRALGDVRWGELERLEREGFRHAWLMRLIRRHAQADAGMKVREVVKPEDVQRFQQKAAELEDAI
jgi:hypothetical protein